MPAWSMGKTTRRIIVLCYGIETGYSRHRQSVPGPGQYGRVEDHPIRKKSPSWTMGIGKRDPLAIAKNVPGPGAYDPKAKVLFITIYY